MLPLIAAHVDPTGWEVVELVAEGDTVVSRCFVPCRATREAEPVRTVLVKWMRLRDGRIVEIGPLLFDTRRA